MEGLDERKLSSVSVVRRMDEPSSFFTSAFLHHQFNYVVITSEANNAPSSDQITSGSDQSVTLCSDSQEPSQVSGFNGQGEVKTTSSVS